MTYINSEFKIQKFGEGKAVYSLGGGDALTKFVPNLNMSFPCQAWDEKEQFFINLNRKDVTIITEKPVLSVGELNLKVGNQTDIWKIVQDKETGRDLLKWNIQFDEKPTSNTLDWELKCSSNLSFWRQENLEYQFENYGGEGYKTLSEFLDKAHQPENVLGSYAVYCDRAHNIRFPDGRIKANYSTGKLTHIFRPLVIDNNGKTAWAELFIDPKNGLLRITMPQSFLDNARYPITLDPTIFGHDSQGATTIDLTEVLRGVEGTSSGAGTGDNLGLYLASWGSGEKIKMALYVSSTGNLLTNGQATERSDGGYGRELFSLASSPNIAASTDYLPIAWGDNTGKGIYYDSTSCTRMYRGYSYNGWPDPHGGTYGSSTYKYSTFCEYTESGGEAPSIIPMIMHHQRQLRN